MEQSLKNKTIFGFVWRFLQNAGTQVVGFIISIVLARILTPDDYGVIALISTFTSIAMVCIQTGFSSSIVQKKELSDTDINTMFYSSAALGIALYGLLFVSAPGIAVLYKTPLLTDLLRVQGLMVVIGSLYSVPQSLINRNLKFKKSFFVSAVGIVIQGIAGIILALKGMGPWALVYSSLIHYVVSAVLMWCVVRFKPKLEFSGKSFRNMFSFSAKMLAMGLLDSLFNNIRSIIIGIRYTAADLAYYNKGRQFPNLIMAQVDGSITTVLFSSLSKFQSDWSTGLRVLRRAMKTSLFVCLPLMAGMCAVADPMIRVLLTDKWAESAVYVRLACIICMFWPMSAQRHALNARGKSGISLKMNVIGKTVTVICLLLTFQHSVKLMIASSIFASIICLFINAYFYRKHLDYRFRDQVADILPPVLLSAAMGLITYAVTFLNLSNMITLLIQVPVGIAVYILGAMLFKFDSFYYILGFIKDFLSKRKKKA